MGWLLRTLDRLGLKSGTRQELACEECLKTGTQWVHLRRCLTCGHIGCCDSSEGHHATRHFIETGHPIMESAEPGENWRWSYVKKDYV